jgi:hypothetical protein
VYPADPDSDSDPDPEHWLTPFLTSLIVVCAAGHEHERRSGRRRRGELHLCPAGQGGSEQVLEAFPPAGRRRATRRQAHLCRDGEQQSLAEVLGISDI